MRNVARLPSVLVALPVLLLANPAAAEEPLGPVLVLAPEGNAEHQETLRTAMAAHLSGYSVEVLLEPTGPLPESFPDQAEAARTAARDHRALAAIWIDERHGMVFVLVAAPDADQILQRPLPGAEEPWRTRCDAVASMVHSALAPWLEREEPVEPEPVPATANPIPATADPTQIEDPEVPADPVPEPDLPASRNDWLLLQLRAGYGPVFVNRIGSVQHGGRVAVGLIFGDHVEAEAALDLLFPLEAADVGEERDDDALVRWPLRFAVGGFVTALDLDLGIKAGLVIDFTHVKGVENAAVKDNTERINPGFAASLYARYRILDWLGVWAEGGIDIYNSAYDYMKNETAVIKYSALQGRVSGGVSFLFTLD